MSDWLKPAVRYTPAMAVCFKFMSVYHFIFSRNLKSIFRIASVAPRLIKASTFLTSLLNLSCENKPLRLSILAHFVYFATSNVRTVQRNTPTLARISLSDSSKVRGRLTEIAEEFPANMIDFMIALSPQLVFMLSRHAKSFQHDKWHKKGERRGGRQPAAAFTLKPTSSPTLVPPLALLMA